MIGRAATGGRTGPAAYKWLALRRTAQLAFLALFLAGPWAGVWIVEGTLASSMTLDVLPLTDPLVLLQTLAAGHLPAQAAIVGALLVLGGYLLVGGRAYCAWVCPVNPITDLAHWARQRLGLPKGWQPARASRYWLLGAVLVLSAVTGTVTWEAVNPVTLLHRALLFGVGAAWTVIVALFVFDLLVSRRGWCGHLCPVGAFYGLIGALSALRVRAARRAACDDCRACYAVCPEPQVITPALKGAPQGHGPVLLSGDCSNCGRCIDVCPQEVFVFGWRFDNRDAAGTPAPKIRISGTAAARPRRAPSNDDPVDIHTPHSEGGVP